jgi:hypothetical protein
VLQRRYLRIGLAAVAVAAIALGPYALFWLAHPRTLEVVIVDKTTPFPNYREHAAIPWILHALKIEDALGKYLDPTRDYIGFDPAAKKGRTLTPDLLANADVVYIADTYGVYAGDYERPGQQAALERSPKIYGGLDDGEAAVVDAFAARGGMAIAEFNTFGSPTEDGPRARLEGTFGVRWTRWVGRYWPNLRDPNEVPRWVGKVYERVNGRPFDFGGGGMVFVKDDVDIVVLRDGDELRQGVITQERTAEGAEFAFPERGHFRYWMDVVTATDAEVIYEHVLDVSSAGERALAKHGLPRRFPAVTKRRDAWYFAGDFVDNSFDLGSPERAGLLAFRDARAGCGGVSPEEDFFWRFFVPIVSRLFASRAR